MEDSKKHKGSRKISRRSALKATGALVGAGVAGAAGISLPVGKSSRALAKQAWGPTGRSCGQETPSADQGRPVGCDNPV